MSSTEAFTCGSVAARAGGSRASASSRARSRTISRVCRSTI